MIRPRNEIFLVICGRIELARLGRMVQALVVFCYAIPTCGVEWTALRVLTLVIMCVSGVAVFSGLFILHAALCFFTIDGIELMNILINGGMTMSAYPLDIYGRGILWFATFVVPFACIQYYPFLYIIGRTDSLVNVFLPLIGILFIIPCYLFWKFGVRHYKSVGS
jgi:ABC-2 type transport system permease protein